MSKGLGRIERRIGQLFAATKDRALSIGEIAAYAFELTDGVAPDRKQRLSATRAAHRLLRRAAAATETIEIIFERLIEETTETLGRPPTKRRAVLFWVGSRLRGVDQVFSEAMESAPSWSAWKEAWSVMDREKARFDGVLVGLRGGWRATEAKDHRLWFHPADWPVRVWAVSIEPQGVSWAEAEIVGIDNTYVRVRYRGEPARLDRDQLSRSWTIYRNVFFTSNRGGYAARSFERMWWQRHSRPGVAPPPTMQMDLAEAVSLLGVPRDFTREDIIAAFRREAMRCHPDHGGTEEQFITLLKARDRLLAALGAKAAAPKVPSFAPKGTKLRYGVWRPNGGVRVGHTRRLTR
jgi:hypothetical protein